MIPATIFTAIKIKHIKTYEASCNALDIYQWNVAEVLGHASLWNNVVLNRVITL